MKKLKIATVIPPHVNLNSSYFNLAKVYSYIVKNYNAEITVFVDNKLNFSFDKLKAIKVTSIDNNFGLYKVLFFLGLPRLFYIDLVRKLKGFDVIETSSPEFYGYAIQSWIAAKKYNAKLCLRHSTTYYNFFLFPYTKFIALSIAKKAANYASKLMFSNPQSMQRYIDFGLVEKNSKKIVILGHATDTSIFKPVNVKKNNKKDSNKTVLLSVGALIKVKGHQNAIKALKLLVDKGHKAELWIAGEGNDRQWLQDIVKSEGVEEYVKFFGRKNHNELALIYNKADIFVLANLQEITPAVNEALACKKPVVVMECGGADFVIPNRNYGIVTKKNDIRDFADGIEFFLKNRKKATESAEKGYKRVIENFSIEKVAEKIYKAYCG